MADPAAEGYSVLDSEGSSELLKALPFRAVTDHGEPGQTASQKWSSPAQSKIASLQRNQAANENQLEFGAGLRPARIVGAHGAVYAGLRDKKQFVAIFGKLGTDLRRSGYDCCRVAISGPGKRHKPVQIPKTGDPFPLVLELAKTRRPRQTAIERPDHEWYRPVAQEESERTWHHCCHRVRRRTTSNSPAKMRRRNCRQARHSKAIANG